MHEAVVGVGLHFWIGECEEERHWKDDGGSGGARRGEWRLRESQRRVVCWLNSVRNTCMPPNMDAGGAGGCAGAWATGSPKPMIPSTPLKSAVESKWRLWGARGARGASKERGRGTCADFFACAPGELQSVMLPNLEKAKYSPN